MAWLKLETAAGLQFAELQLVSNDIKSDGLGSLLMKMKVKQQVFRLSFHQNCSTTTNPFPLDTISYWSSEFSSVV